MHSETLFCRAQGLGAEEVTAAIESVGGRGVPPGRYFGSAPVQLAQSSQRKGSSRAGQWEVARAMVSTSQGRRGRGNPGVVGSGIECLLSGERSVPGAGKSLAAGLSRRLAVRRRASAVCEGSRPAGSEADPNAGEGITAQGEGVGGSRSAIGAEKKAGCVLGGGRRRGQLTSAPERKQLIEWIGEAVEAGSRRWRACEEAGLSLRTLQRWVDGDTVKADARPTAVRPAPLNKLSQVECEQVLAVCNAPEYAHLPPSQIVPRLADQGTYLASESTLYRILKARDQGHHRGRAHAPRTVPLPTSHTATAPNQLWSWDSVP